MLSFFAHCNKKVLLRERKRHTARRVASARYAALSSGGGRVTPGTPPSRPGQGYPGYHPHHPDLAGVPPHPRPGMGYPPTIQTWPGYPPTQTWDGVPPTSDLGWVPPLPHHPDLAGVPPPPSSRPGWGTPSRCGLTHKVKILPSPILGMRAVINKLSSVFIIFILTSALRRKELEVKMNGILEYRHCTRSI